MVIYFVFFSPRSKTKRNPARKTTHLQTTASQPCKPRFAKELFPPSRPYYKKYFRTILVFNLSILKKINCLVIYRNNIYI